MENLFIRNEMTEKEKAYIREALFQFNVSTAPPNQKFLSKDIHLALEDEKHQISGGLLGKLYRNCLYVEILWIHEEQRGCGYGAKLLQKAESIAREEGCTFVHLDTFNFQAPDFYEKQGYEIYGVLDLYSDGIKRFYLKKKLVD